MVWDPLTPVRIDITLTIPNTKDIEKTVFDRHYVGSATTSPAPISGFITDSAAAATALASGIKTYNNAIGVDVNKKPVETVLERAKLRGKKTGVVVTSQINHATPAAYLTHNEFRRNYNQIADSYIDNGFKADVYLGGGWHYFIRDDRHLVSEFEQSGFQYINNYNDLLSLSSNKPVLGLFGKKGLPWAMDDTDKHRLSTMTKSAIKHLENDKGFFMLIEASQVDWAGHGRDIASAMYEMDDLAKTVEYLEQYVNEHPDTLVILTADHSTGGLSIGRKTGKKSSTIKSSYLWLPDLIKTMNMSVEAFGRKFSKESLSKGEMTQVLNIPLTTEEFELLNAAKRDGIAIINAYHEKPKSQGIRKYPPVLYQLIAKQLKNIIDVRTNTGWGGIK